MPPSFGAKPPESLMTLTPAARVAAGQTMTVAPGEAVMVLIPTVPQALATTRVPVETGATTLAYVKDAQWVDAPNRLFYRLLAETIEARSGRSVLSPRQSAFDPGLRVFGELTAFGVDASDRSAVVRYDATIQRGEALTTRRFEARVPIAAIDATNAGAGINQAANQIAAQVSDWIAAGK